MLIIKDNNITYRIRKEEEGCSIFTPKYFIEGNDTLFEILKTFNEFGVKKGIQQLFNEYSDNADDIKKDLLEIANEFSSGEQF